MGVPTSEVGYTSATTGRGDQEVYKGHVMALEKKIYGVYLCRRYFSMGAAPRNAFVDPVKFSTLTRPIIVPIFENRKFITRQIHISPSTSSGQRNCASWASQPQKSVTFRPQPGGETTKSIRDMWWWGKIIVGQKSVPHDRTFHEFCPEVPGCLLTISPSS
jgi:hypothetical protein